jgi:hypothetical protein
LQVRKLLIDVNPYSLKGAGCRILALLTGFDDVTHDLGKLARGVERPKTVGLCPASNKRLCNLKSKPFFPIISYHLRQFLHRSPREPLGRRLAARRIHAHVQRAIGAEAEAARWIVHLRRGHAQVQQHPDTFSTPRAASASRIDAKLSCTIEKRASSMRCAVSIALGSLSNAISRPPGASRASTARLWPPRPNVPST